MRINHRNYVVEYDDGVNAVEVFPVRVVTADTLAAEQHAPTLGINNPGKVPITMNLMWVWRAALREERIPKGTSWPAFVKACLEWRPADNDDVIRDDDVETPAEVEVPPTVPGLSPGSSSTSAPTASPASTSMAGDEPPSTTSSS